MNKELLEQIIRACSNTARTAVLKYDQNDFYENIHTDLIKAVSILPSVDVSQMELEQYIFNQRIYQMTQIEDAAELKAFIDYCALTYVKGRIANFPSDEDHALFKESVLALKADEYVSSRM